MGYDLGKGFRESSSGKGMIKEKLKDKAKITI